MNNSLADGGSSSRVSIPRHLRETLQSIREITGKQHSDEDIYAVYKESFNDPFETAQKLRFLDTFHEVKSKRDKKKENLVPINQASARTGRRNFASTNTYHGNGRNASVKRESGANHVTGGSRNSLPNTNNRARKPTAPRPIKVSGPTSGASNHQVENDFSVTVNKRGAEKNPLSKSTSFSEDGVEPETSKASSEQVDAPVSVSLVQNHLQDAIPAQVSQPVVNKQPAELQSPTFGPQDQVTGNENASKKDKAQSLLKSDVGGRSHVTFPLHLQIAEGLQNGLTFGSFDSNFVKEASSDYGASDSDFKSSYGTGDDERDSSPTTNGIHAVASARGASSYFEDKDHGISNSAPGAELVQHSGHIVSPGEDELREEALPKTQPHQIGYGQEAPFNVFGLVPSFSALGQPVNTEAAETQPGNSNAPAISLVSYPPGQGSIAAVSQQATHLFGQQYPPSFFPYGPYYSPFYMPPPPYMHQFLGPNGIPQQSYFPPGAHIAPVGDNENPPTTNPSPHASSTVATHIPSATSLNSIHGEERTSPMTGNAAAWLGQGLGNLQMSQMYNLAALQGQPLGFPVVQAGHRGLMGIHQPSQPMPALSTTYQTLTPLPPPPLTTTAMSEPIRHPNIAHQQPQAGLTNRVNSNY